MTQNQRILRDLERGRVLTPLTALRRYGCLRLAARIADLRAEGHAIQRRLTQRNGKRFAVYWL